ncbi:MAG: septal ring lytic transglycosylase RlpA family protein [Ignavibacterium sp.]|uniref:septal ring lytic transglycosylase RlpA family protein n=1 Tax=Ignavibacterium sp. TaxID=2651167 RepID=UPI00404AE53A
MKLNYLLLATLTIIFFSACASSKRFTSDKAHQNESKSQFDNENLEFIEQGIASYYADEYHGKKTASGEIYNMNDYTAAHPSLPFGVFLLVKNLKNNKSVIVRVNDRMPDFKNRVIDLSLAAAKKLEMISEGTVEVKIYRVRK